MAFKSYDSEFDNSVKTVLPPSRKEVFSKRKEFIPIYSKMKEFAYAIKGKFAPTFTVKQTASDKKLSPL